MNNPHIGGSFDDFLREDGSLETTTAVATKRVNDWQVSSGCKDLFNAFLEWEYVCRESHLKQ